MISFVPRPHGHYGWATYTFIFVCFVKRRCSRISCPWSHVRERRSCAGGVRTSRAKARHAITASLAVSNTSSVNRIVRSTMVPNAESFTWADETGAGDADNGQVPASRSRKGAQRERY